MVYGISPATCRHVRYVRYEDGVEGGVRHQPRHLRRSRCESRRYVAVTYVTILSTVTSLRMLESLTKTEAMIRRCEMMRLASATAAMGRGSETV